MASGYIGMNEKFSKAQSNSYTVQEYLSLGYRYLILLGIIGDVIYFKFLTINILSYSAVSDVLMPTVNTLFQDFRVLLMVIFMIGMVHLLYVHLIPHFM